MKIDNLIEKKLFEAEKKVFIKEQMKLEWRFLVLVGIISVVVLRVVVLYFFLQLYLLRFLTRTRI